MSAAERIESRPQCALLQVLVFGWGWLEPGYEPLHAKMNSLRRRSQRHQAVLPVRQRQQRNRRTRPERGLHLQRNTVSWCGYLLSCHCLCAAPRAADGGDVDQPMSMHSSEEGHQYSGQFAFPC